DAEAVEDSGLGWGDLGALAEGPGGTGEGAGLDPVELAAQFGPGAVGGVLGDAGEEQGEPAQDDVGADPFFLAVIDGPQVDDLLQLGDHAGADRGVPLCSFGVVADDEPLVLGDADFLDPQVRRDFLVAALPGQGSPGLGGAGAEPLADDVVVPALAQAAAVL